MADIKDGRIAVEGTPRHCETCGKRLRAGDKIAYTAAAARMWHSECFEKTLRPLKELAKQHQ